MAGSLNFKHKYAPEFPTVRLVEGMPQRTVSQAELQALGLLAAPEPMTASQSGRTWSGRRAKVWPSYERCLQNAPLAHRRDRPDVSRADFTFCLLAIDWGWSIAETCARLLENSSKAREHGVAYARLTTERAAAVIYRRNFLRTSPL